jgi:hypothetical protein
MIKIEPKYEEKVLKYSNHAISLYEPDFSLVGGNIFEFFEYVYAISKYITNIKNHGNAREIIKKALEIYRKRNNTTIEDLRISLNEAEEEFLGEKLKKYFFVFPVNIKYNSLRRKQVSLLKKIIKIRNYDFISKKYDLNDLEKKSTHDGYIENSLNKELTYLIIEECSRGSERAIRQALHEFDLFRAILNFSHDSMRIHFTGGLKKPLSLVCPRKTFFAFDSDGSFISHWIVIEKYDDKIVDLASSSASILENSNTIIRKLNDVRDDSLRHHMANALIFYSNALDHYDNIWISFLSYWQIIELLALGKNNSKQQDICKRMAALLGSREPYEDILDQFKDKRNRLVHQGEFENISEDDTNIIKGIVEYGILNILMNANKFQNIQGLNLYYENVNSMEEDIKLKKSILNLIQKRVAR